MVDLFIVCLEIKATVLQFNHLYLKPLVFVLKTITLPPFFHPFIYKDETFSPRWLLLYFFFGNTKHQCFIPFARESRPHRTRDVAQFFQMVGAVRGIPAVNS